MANDELTLGCKISIDREIVTIVDSDRHWDWITILREDWWVTRDDYENEFIIIWHPVMIGTIFEWYSSSRWFINSQFVIHLIERWTGYDKPIEEQSDECIDYVYSLIQKY